MAAAGSGIQRRADMRSKFSQGKPKSLFFS